MSGRLVIFRRSILTAILAVTVCICAVEGKIIYVDDDANAPGDGTTWNTAYKYLQDALADAGSATKPVEIRIAAGLYLPDRTADQPNGTGDRLASFEPGGVALLGGYAGIGAADPNTRDAQLYETILSGDLAGNDVAVDDPCDLRNEPTRGENSCNIIRIVHGSGTRLEGLTITGGFADIGSHGGVLSTQLGAGLYADQTNNLTLRDCSFVGNYAQWAVGACRIIDSPGALLEECTFSHNSSSTTGALAVLSSDATLSGCHINGNFADSTGGLTIVNSDVKVLDSLIEDNAAIWSDGGVGMARSTVKLSRCVIRGNSVESGIGGGGVGASEGDYSFVECRFHNNEAVLYGGGMALGSGNVSLSNCILSGNCSQNGGVVYVASAQADIRNCTITGNKAESGSFVCAGPASLPGHNGGVIIADSIVDNGGNEVFTAKASISIEHSLLSTDPNTIIDPNHNVTWGVGNIDVDPWFADSGHWDPNGTHQDETDDFWVDGDYHLKSQAGRWDVGTQSWVVDDVTSPCIDAGDPMSPIGLEPFPNGGRVNMGAYGGTAQASRSYFGGPVCETVVAGDVNGDCRVDFGDFAIIALHWMWTPDQDDSGGSGNGGGSGER